MLIFTLGAAPKKIENVCPDGRFLLSKLMISLCL